MKLKAIGQNPAFKRLTDMIVRLAPIAALVAIGAYIAAQQAISPQRRVVKFAVLMGLLALMLRFDMVYSVYLFTILFPFPSGVSIGSTNSILMTLIPLIWVIRGASTKAAVYFRRTNADFAIVLFLLAYLVSFINVDDASKLQQHLKVMWKTAATVMFFYTIVTFVNDEKKIFTLVKISCCVCGLLMFTALLELFMPGQSLIPGWIRFSTREGVGELGYRIRGIRVGGALGSQAMMADFAARTMFLLILLTVRTRNLFQKAIWACIGALSLATIAATANRGALTSIVVGGVYLVYQFRKQISLARIVMLTGVLASLLASSEYILTRHTYAVSLSQRLRGTYFEGVVPDSRRNTWKPTLIKGLKHPFVGRGPFYDVGEGLTYQFWPHNGFLYFFYTVGIFGLLSFCAICFHLWKYSRNYKLPHVRGSPLADLAKVLNGIMLVTFVQQMRTDHQRDDVYPYMIWFLFGLIATTGIVLEEMSKERAARAAESTGGGGPGEGKNAVQRRRGGRLKA